MSLHMGRPEDGGHVKRHRQDTSKKNYTLHDVRDSEELKLIDFPSHSILHPGPAPLSQRALLLWYENAYNCQRCDGQHWKRHSKSNLPGIHVTLAQAFSGESLTSFLRRCFTEQVIIRRSVDQEIYGSAFQWCTPERAVCADNSSLGGLEAMPDEQPSHSDLELNWIACPVAVTLIGQLERGW